MKITQHARQRMQQRSIAVEIVDHIIAFGEWTRHRRADVYYMTQATREALRTRLGSAAYAAIEKKLGAYVVLSDRGWVITTAHRLNRLKVA